MKIYNKDKTEIIENPNLELGYLTSDTIVTHHDAEIVHHDAVVGVEEQGHYEVIREYPETGGKDVKWVVDVKGVEAKEAYDETISEAYDSTEQIQVYTLYTEEQLATNKANREIAEAKTLLSDSDYTIIKFMDSYIKANPELLAKFESEYSGLLAERANARETINNAETVIASL